LDLSYPFLCRLISSSESSMTHLCHNVQHLSLRMIVGSMQLKVLALGVHLPEPLCILELPEHRWRESGTICTGLLEPRFVLSIGWFNASINYVDIYFDRAVYGTMLC
jgi:hypothetical protein